MGKQGVASVIFFISAKLLVPEQFGVYNYVLAIVFFFALLGDFGISNGVTKYVAEYRITDQEKLRAVLFNMVLIILGVALVVSVAIVLFGEGYFGDNYQYILYLLPMIFFIPITSLYEGIYAGLKLFRRRALLLVAVGAVAVGFTYSLITQHGLVGAIIAQLAFYLLLTIALALGYRDFHLRINRAVIKEVGSYALYFGVAGVGYYLYTRVDTLMLGHFGFYEELGHYEIINKIFLLLIFPATTLGSVVAPNSTKNFVQKRYRYIKKKMLQESLGLGAVGVVIALVALLTARFAFATFLREYDTELLLQLLHVLLILIPLRFFSTYISTAYIAPSGHVKILTKYLLIFGVVNVLLNFILIRWMGFIGVVYATLISQVLFILFKDVFTFIPLIRRLARDS